MPAIFQKVDKIRLAYDTTYRAVLLLCKLLLVMDIPITTMAVAGRYIPFAPNPAQSEEVVLTCMSYVTVLSAALAIGRGAHICMTTFDRYLPPKLVRNSDIVADLAALALAVIMITVSWEYATGIGAKSTYVSIPKVSRLWMCFPVSLARVAMLVFEVEALYNHAKSFFAEEGVE